MPCDACLCSKIAWLGEALLSCRERSKVKTKSALRRVRPRAMGDGAAGAALKKQDSMIESEPPRSAADKATTRSCFSGWLAA